MELDIHAFAELCAEPVLVIRENRIAVLNSAAQKLLRGIAPGRSASGIIPDHVLAAKGEKFVSSGTVGGVACSIAVLRTGGSMLLTLNPLEKQKKAGMLPDTLIASMLSTVCNAGLAADRLGASIDGPSNPKAAEYMAILNHNVYSMRRIITNIGAAVLLQRGCIDFYPENTDLAELCTGLVSTCSALLGDEFPTLEFSCAHNHLFACVDGGKVERILLNLISNSLAHTPAGGKIKLGLSVSGGNAVLSVDDNGSGIPEDVLRSIFSRSEEPFSSPANFSSGCSGGLGLEVSRGFAQLHGGALIIESRVGEGTSVRVLLPLEQHGSTLKNPGLPYADVGLTQVLIELSCILESSHYRSQYLD